MAAEPKVEKIVAELLRRIKAAFPRVFIQRGFFGDENTIWPAIYIDDDVENSELDRTRKRGMYDRKASVTVSYFFKGPTNMETAKATANLEKAKLCNALELDDTFAGLCTHYGEVECNKIFYKTNGIQVAVEYVFEYSEPAAWATPTIGRM